MNKNLSLSTILLIAALYATSPATISKAANDVKANNIVGANECGECHSDELEVWKKTHHFKTWREMHRTKESKDIAAKLGIKKGIKRNPVCLTCHYTAAVVNGKEKPISGVSCESCHGPAKNWIDIHSDFGGKDITAATESKEHRAQRLNKSIAAGMIMANDTVAIARNCLSCHVVPNEKLVNVGKHTAGSKFELLSWSQGEIRHNFINEQGSNQAASPAHKRVLFIIGTLVDLETSLKAVALATEKATYAQKMAKRAALLKKKLSKIQQLLNLEELTTALSAANKVKLKLNNQQALQAAAKKIAKAAIAINNNYDGSELAAIDNMLPDPKSYKGQAK